MKSLIPLVASVACFLTAVSTFASSSVIPMLSCAGSGYTSQISLVSYELPEQERRYELHVAFSNAEGESASQVVPLEKIFGDELQSIGLEGELDADRVKVLMALQTGRAQELPEQVWTEYVDDSEGEVIVVPTIDAYSDNSHEAELKPYFGEGHYFKLSFAPIALAEGVQRQLSQTMTVRFWSKKGALDGHQATSIYLAPDNCRLY